MRIKHLRLERGLTQADLGKLIGESKETISNWERGISRPSIDNAIKLADVLKVSLDELMDRPLVNHSHFHDKGEGCHECAKKDFQIEQLTLRLIELKKYMKVLEKISGNDQL